MMGKELYNLELGETLYELGNGRNSRTSVMRVPGGWIFTYHFEAASSVFVPFNNEFQNK